MALAFFAFAQAASARSGAQSAADAAALAAAQQARDELLLDLEDAITAGDDWLDWLDLTNGGVPADGASDAAADLAAQNNSFLQGGAELIEVDGNPGFQVDVETDYTVGDSIIPGTESMTATARAAAVIQPRCQFDVASDPTKPVALDCDGQIVDIDPGNFDPDDLPDASVMFSVYLAE